MFAGGELANGIRILRWTNPERRGFGDRSLKGLGIVRRDHATGERKVGEILAIGVEFWVGQVGRTGEGKFLSAGARRRALAR